MEKSCRKCALKASPRPLSNFGWGYNKGLFLLTSYVVLVRHVVLLPSYYDFE